MLQGSVPLSPTISEHSAHSVPWTGWPSQTRLCVLYALEQSSSLSSELDVNNTCQKKALKKQRNRGESAGGDLLFPVGVAVRSTPQLHTEMSSKHVGEINSRPEAEVLPARPTPPPPQEHSHHIHI